jgi:hypothetical protein
MTVDDLPGRVTICTRGRSSLSADDLGVTAQNFPGHPRRFLWSEISRFADGRQAAGDSPPANWVLDIVLHSGQTYSVDCTRAGSAAPETLAAIRQVAERHGIHADLTGIVMASDGRPDSEGLYEDPWGQAGVRYWDGKQWSPLLPSDHGISMSVWQSTARWTELPVAEASWTYPARRVKFYRIWVGVCTALTLIILAVGLTTGLLGHWSDNERWGVACAGIPGFLLVLAWFGLRQSKQLEKVASAKADHLN